MKFITSITALLVAASLANAQLVVTDPIAHTLTRIDHAQDIAKYIEMVNNQIRQINTMTQELQQVTAYVKAFGDPVVSSEYRWRESTNRQSAPNWRRPNAHSTTAVRERYPSSAI